MSNSLAVQRVLIYYDDESARRSTVIRQLLTNRLTTSSRFWGMCYELLDIVNTDYELGMNLERISDLAVDKGWLEKDSDSAYLLTPCGKKVRDDYLSLHKKLKKPELFAKYSYRKFSALVTLCVQVASELSFGNRSYVPITTDYHLLQMFKEWYLAYGKAGVAEVRIDLEKFLKEEDEIDAAVFMSRFAGHETSGRTKEQIADDYNLEVSDVVITERDLMIRFGEFVINEGGSLAELFKHELNEGLVSSSALKTYEMVCQGKSADEVARFRRLKSSTVIEHLLDCAIVFDEFPFERFVSLEKRSRIEEVYAGQKTVCWDFHKLEGTGISFYEYRLVQIERIKENESTY